MRILLHIEWNSLSKFFLTQIGSLDRFGLNFSNRIFYAHLAHAVKFATLSWIFLKYIWRPWRNMRRFTCLYRTWQFCSTSRRTSYATRYGTKVGGEQGVPQGKGGFVEALQSMQSAAAFIAVSDISQGYTELNTTPHTRRVKTVFFAMRHALDDMEARQECMDIMRELFRQFMSVLIQEKTRVEEEHIYLDPRISFQEIDRYFLSGCACAFFQVATDVYTDLRYNQEEWE